ncbi:MAG: transcriptional regulator, partial [Hyphomicrobiaceae bacterium]
MKLRFANCEIDTLRHEFRANGIVVSIEPQVFDLLAYLANNPNRLITKDELVEAVWDGRAISDSSITSRINGARKAVSDDGFRQEVIATVPRRGFR